MKDVKRCEIFSEHEANSWFYTDYLPSVEKATLEYEKQKEIERLIKINEILKENLKRSKMIEWILSKKDLLTTIFGFIVGFVQVISGWLTTGDLNLWTLIQAIFTFCIAWFIGKSGKK